MYAVSGGVTPPAYPMRMAAVQAIKVGPEFHCVVDEDGDFIEALRLTEQCTNCGAGEVALDRTPAACTEDGTPFGDYRCTSCGTGYERSWRTEEICVLDDEQACLTPPPRRASSTLVGKSHVLDHQGEKHGV